jgi:hypothetical protein
MTKQVLFKYFKNLKNIASFLYKNNYQFTFLIIRFCKFFRFKISKSLFSLFDLRNMTSLSGTHPSTSTSIDRQLSNQVEP